MSQRASKEIIYNETARLTLMNQVYALQQATNSIGGSRYRKITIDDADIPQEIKKDPDAEHTMYVYEDGKCVGKIEGEEMERVKKEMDERLE